MKLTTFSSREFNQNPNKVKTAAEHNTVFITDRGKTAYVMLSAKEYEKLTNKKGNKDIISLLAMDRDIDFDVPKLPGGFKAEDFD
ncbi:type II toxin-antitoxin system Phd/YefM family antitoxin [Facilibium subflavum]|uniref:type II toxin-antitoxin system Phd/YefM family antitoxin n=1 Tax=Facilibium subflavum TaxID=2219058 RepID=UPI000E64E616|nr:type II toxin-antitoxin system Phd/YefM family antitoxin [Facilibium subflavum]